MLGGHVLVLEVIAGKNIAVPSNRTPVGYYVGVSTSYGQWNTAIKAAMANCSIYWNETFTIHARPLTFPLWFMPIFSGKSKAIRLEIRASFECGQMLGRGELVGTVETTLDQLLAHNGQSISCSAVDNQCISLTLKVQRIKSTQLVDHAASSTAEGVANDQLAYPPAVVRSTGITGQPTLPLSGDASSSSLETPPWRRNVVIFGETGSGKSSIINAIAREQLAETSDDATGCTSGHKRHPVTISGQRFILIDTVGLGEGPAGTVPAAEAKRQLKSLLRELMSSRSPSDGIGLLVYCVSSRTTAPPTLIRAYNTVYSRICQKKVPIVLVITGLENEPDMESWWDANNNKFKSMHFADHACITGLQRYPDIPDVFIHRIEESSETLRNLVVKNSSDWVVDDSWFKQSFAVVRNMISDSSERSLPSTLIICDSSRNEEVEIAHCIRGTLRPYFAHIGGDTYQVHRVPAPDSPSSNAERRLEGDLLIYYARVDELSAARQKFYAFCTAYRGNVVPVVVVVKGLDDRQAAHQWVDKYIMYDNAGRLFSTFAPAEELGDNSLKQQAEQELQDLIRQACLIRSERKVRGKQKRIARRNRPRIL
ncbi:hypothetical protein EDB19DRAFT_2041699 [Suillus lakei]|nr:hypothetical protein EDB19DRAFT_2041699 [Suillus lakei]